MDVNNSTIYRNEECVVVTPTGNHQGTVLQVTASTVRIIVNGVSYRYNRRYVRRTRFQRLIIEVL